MKKIRIKVNHISYNYFVIQTKRDDLLLSELIYIGQRHNTEYETPSGESSRMKLVNLWREATQRAITFGKRLREERLELVENTHGIVRVLVRDEQTETERSNTGGANFGLDLLVFDKLDKRSANVRQLLHR